MFTLALHFVQWLCYHRRSVSSLGRAFYTVIGTVCAWKQFVAFSATV